jgi:hypothetical protein
MAVHGWDVATATGQRLTLSDGAARLVLDVVVRHGDLYRQYDGFADPVPVPAGRAGVRAGAGGRRVGSKAGWMIGALKQGSIGP